MKSYLTRDCLRESRRAATRNRRYLAAQALSPPRTRASSVAIVPGWAVGHPSELPEISLDWPVAYQLVPDIYACVTIIQSEIAALPLKFFIESVDGDERVDVPRAPGTITELWARANEHQTDYEVKEGITGSLDIWGNAYLFMDAMRTGVPRELYVLPPHRVRPRQDASGGGMAFEFWFGGGTSRVLIPGSDVVWFRNWSPNMMDTGLGTSPLEPLRQTYETQYDAARWQREFFKKGAVVSGYYSTEDPLSDEDREALLKDLKAQSQSIDKAWDPVLLFSGLKFERSGVTQQEMDYAGNAARTTEDVLRVFRIPPTVFGIKRGGALGSDGADVEWLLYYQQCIKPRTKRIERSLNEFFCPRFGPRVRCEFDFSGVLPFQQVFLSQSKAYAEATGAPTLTTEEARRRQGLPIEPEDGELYVPYNLTTKSMLDQPQPQPNPVAPTNPAAPPGPDQTAARDRMRALAVRDVRRHERMFRRGLGPYFTRQEQRVVDRVREQGIRGLQRVIDVDRMLEDAESDRELARNLIRAVVDERGQEVIDELAAELTFSAFSERADAFVRQKAARMVTLVNDTTRKRLRETLADGLANDEGLAELVARVREVYVERRAGGAATIARTETGAAYNYATAEAYEQGGVETKEWLTARDEAVRDSHADLDGQVVPVDQPFVLVDDQGGVWEADYPGDPSLPPDLSINCRCTLLPGSARRSRRREHRNGNGKVDARTLEELLA